MTSKVENGSVTSAVVFILILGSVGYYFYKQNQNKIDTAKKWWSIF